MKKSFGNKRNVLAIACALALVSLCGAAQAQSVKDTAYLNDTRDSVVKSGFGLCWHTGFGPAPASGPECDPNYVAPVAKPVASVVPVAAPIQVAALPTPRPVTPALEKLTLDADTLFDFDKATLRQAGRDTLDSFVSRLTDISPETIMTVGHTDRLGSDAYNQRLSEQRGATVKTYMVSKGVDPSRVFAQGKGETQPVTKAGDCTGPKSAKLIACLQPDRRVDIEVIGTRIIR
jgi:OOP family OmpA-OmpF porin